MNFKISKKEFLDALSLSSRAISSTTPLPALSSIKISASENSLVLISSDSNISIRTAINNNDQNALVISEPGENVIEAKYILEIVRKIDSDFINVETIDGTLLKIYGGNSEFKVNGMDASDYPNIGFDTRDPNPFKLETILYNYGKFSKAAEYYKKLEEEDGKQKEGNLEKFIMAQWAEDVRDASVKKASEIISGLIFRSINYLIYNDHDAAVANERIARYIYKVYMSDMGASDRTKLPPFNEMKKSVVDNCIRVFPPAVVEILKARIAAEQAETAIDAGLAGQRKRDR